MRRLQAPAASPPALARAFTLVEMLVAMVVLLVLVSATIGVVNVSLDDERVRSGARQLQSYLMGARDRAVYSRLPRGVRFEFDPNSTQARPLLKSVVYIGASQDWSQGSLTVRRNATNSLANLLVGEFTEWNTLKLRGSLGNTARIQLGSRWYTVTTGLLTASDEVLVISPPLVNPQPVDETDVTYPAWPVTARFNEGAYRLTLLPRILPNERPVQLPPGIVLDMNYCRLPGTWQAPYFDIMFAPRGSVIGEPAAAGVLHFLLNDIKDITLQLVPWDTRNKTEKRVVTLFTRTGNVITSELFPGETAIGIDIDRNGTIDPPGPRNLFYYAERGEVSE